MIAEFSGEQVEAAGCGNRTDQKQEVPMTQKPDRDIEKDYPLPEFIEKLRRLADALEQGKRFEIQIAGERISVPVRASFNIEHERGQGQEEIEFQIKWVVE
ncbi:amphi-Trp domain-containing protein [Pseudosulfitobacter koreensis]|nr:amphi-Trp domain-containing protein [Pseudosulfitobacter koreense]